MLYYTKEQALSIYTCDWACLTDNFADMCYIPVHLADSVKAVDVGQGRCPSQAAALDSAGRCVTVCVSPDVAAVSVSSPQSPKLMSAAGPTSCPTHESSGHEDKGERDLF